MYLVARPEHHSICRCSKFHPVCQESTTLLVPSMFASLGFMEMMLDEKDSDVALEVHSLIAYVIQSVYEGITNYTLNL